MSTSWESLIEELSNLQHQFIDVAQQVEKSKRNQPGVCGTWSPKQVIAHISGWDKEVIRQFGLFQDGLEKAIEHDIDEFNKKSVKERGHLSWAETIAEVQQTLLLNDLRSRIVVEWDGQQKTERDVAIACLRGAGGFGYSAAPLVASPTGWTSTVSSAAISPSP
jgi:hypothetical protein